MDFIYQFNELVLDFYSKYAPNSLQEPLFQTYFMQMVDVLIVLIFIGAIFIPLRKLKYQMKREKVLVLCFGVFVNLLFLSGLISNKNSDLIRYLALIPVNILFLILYKLGDWLKKFNIETRLDGNLNLKKSDVKNKNIVNCPNCNDKTISYMHAIKEAQTCGECGKSFKAERSRIIELALSLLMLVTLFFGFYLRAKCGFNGFISLIVSLSGSIIFISYQLKPKKLIEVQMTKND